LIKTKFIKRINIKLRIIIFLFFFFQLLNFPISANTEITGKIPHILDSIFVECKDLEIVNKIDEIILDKRAIWKKNKNSCSPLKVSVNKKLINKNEIVSILISNSSDTNIHFSAVLNILSSGKNFEDVYISGIKSKKKSFKKDFFARGMAENPTILATINDISDAVVIKGDFARLNFEAVYGSYEGIDAIRIMHRDIYLLSGSNIEINFNIYRNAGSYFDLVKKISPKISVNHTISFFNVIENRNLINSKNDLINFLNKSNLNVLILVPWLDYDNYNIDDKRFIDRKDYLNIFEKAALAIREVNSDIILLGAVQSNLFVPSPDIHNKLLAYLKYHKLTTKTGLIELPTSLLGTEYIKNENLLVNLNNTITAEYQTYGDARESQIALATSIRLNNQQYLRLHEQVNFLTNVVQLDGFYIDQLSLAFSNESKQRFSFFDWDGISAIVQTINGKKKVIKYNDLALTSISGKKQFLSQQLDKGHFIVANTTPATDTMSSLIFPRFTESFWGGLKFLKKENPKLPPSWSKMNETHLWYPLGLNAPHWMDDFDYTDKAFENLIYNLHGGQISVLNGFRNFNNFTYPQIKIGQLNKIGEGFVFGENQLVTSISGTYELSTLTKVCGAKKFFRDSSKKIISKDLYYQLVERNLKIKINDWSEIAIVNFCLE
jgi:hypothetical protein